MQLSYFEYTQPLYLACTGKIRYMSVTLLVGLESTTEVVQSRKFTFHTVHPGVEDATIGWFSLLRTGIFSQKCSPELREICKERQAGLSPRIDPLFLGCEPLSSVRKMRQQGCVSP